MESLYQSEWAESSWIREPKNRDRSRHCEPKAKQSTELPNGLPRALWVPAMTRQLSDFKVYLCSWDGGEV